MAMIQLSVEEAVGRTLHRNLHHAMMRDRYFTHMSEKEERKEVGGIHVEAASCSECGVVMVGGRDQSACSWAKSHSALHRYRARDHAFVRVVSR